MSTHYTHVGMIEPPEARRDELRGLKMTLWRFIADVIGPAPVALSIADFAKRPAPVPPTRSKAADTGDIAANTITPPFSPQRFHS
ncbi:MAG TPA: hypothetical protein PKD49_10015 [Hyphomicrobium sp.]|nr:hypothetical protein [Hyphomicrobium sp.]